MKRDPRPSLGPVDITVTAGPATVTIPASPAAVWLDALLDPDNITISGDDATTVKASLILDRVLLAMAGSDFVTAVFEAVACGDSEPDALDQVARDMLTEAAGRPWYEVVNLCVVLIASWDSAGGIIALRGLDAGRMSLAAWLDGAYQALREAVAGGKDGGQHLADLERQITREPVMRTGDTTEADMDEAEFLAAAAATL